MFNFSRVLSLPSLLRSGTASLPPAQYHEKQASRRHTLPHQRSHLPQEMQPYTKSRWRAHRFRCRVRPARSAGSNPQRFSRPSAVFNQLHGAKGGLLNFSRCIHLFFFQRLLYCRAQAMSIRSLDAMCNRKMQSFFCLQVLFRMRVLCHIDLFCWGFFDFADDVFHNRLSLLCSKAPCNKIVLHVYYNQKLHKILHSAGPLRRRNREANLQFGSAILATL